MQKSAAETTKDAKDLSLEEQINSLNEQLSTPEGQARLKRLNELYQIRNALLASIATLGKNIEIAKESKQDTAALTSQLAEQNSQLKKTNNDIAKLEGEIEVATPKTKAQVLQQIFKMIALLAGGTVALGVAGGMKA